MNQVAIVCVDDEPSILDSLEIELEKAVGYDYLIEIAEDGEEGLEVCEELLENGDEIALVIADCIMPGMKGDELLKRIHTLSPKTLKILLTGQAELDAVSNAIKHANWYRYIAKPWQSDDFRLTVTEALHSYFQDKKLAEFYAHLEEKIVQRTRELQQKNEALIKLNEEKNEFLGIAPLSAIQGFAEMIICDYDEIPKSEVIDLGNMILTSARQMFALVKNLLDVNAIESGETNISLSKADILPTMRKVVNCYVQRAKAKNITLQFQYEEKPYFAFVDSNTICEVLDNLVSNVVKYSSHGQNVYIRITESECTVRCEIPDEGRGLSEADQQKLFSKFTRLTLGWR